MRSIRDLKEEMRGVARGERKPAPLPAREVLNVLSSVDHMEILRLIHQSKPKTVTELSNLAGRAQSNISRSLQQLVKHGLIELVRDGRMVRPRATAASINISLAEGTYETVSTRELELA